MVAIFGIFYSQDSLIWVNRVWCCICIRYLISISISNILINILTPQFHVQRKWAHKIQSLQEPHTWNIPSLNVDINLKTCWGKLTIQIHTFVILEAKHGRFIYLIINYCRKTNPCNWDHEKVLLTRVFISFKKSSKKLLTKVYW